MEVVVLEEGNEFTCVFNKSRLDLVAAPRGPLIFLSGGRS